jgi:hypothetical protein
MFQEVQQRQEQRDYRTSAATIAAELAQTWQHEQTMLK